jgi:hypothetical protein
MTTATVTEEKVSTAKVNADTARIDTLKELYRSVPMQLDFERVRIMKDVYEKNVGFSKSSSDPSSWQQCWIARRSTSTTTSS